MCCVQKFLLQSAPQTETCFSAAPSLPLHLLCHPAYPETLHMTSPAVSTPVRKRGRPAGSTTTATATKKRTQNVSSKTTSSEVFSDADDSEDSTNDQRSDDEGQQRQPELVPDKEESYEDRVLAVFNAPRTNSLLSIPRPDFADKPHMWFETTQVSHIATVFKCLRKLLNQANVTFAPGGWRIRSTNTTKTALLYLRVTEQTLEDGIYDCNHNYRIRLPIDEFCARLRMFRRSDVMAFSLEGTDPENIKLNFSGGSRHSDITLRLRQPDDESLTIPPKVFHTQVDLPAEELREVVNSVKSSDNLITDVTFTKHPDKFTITVHTIDGDINTHFQSDNTPDSARFYSADMSAGGRFVPVDVDGTPNENSVLTATFPLTEIIAFTEVTRASKWVQINMPEPHNGLHVLKMSYSLAALGEMSFYLSSKVQDDESSDDDDDGIV